MHDFTRDPRTSPEVGERLNFRHTRRPGPSFERFAVFGLAVLAGGMLGLSVFNLMADVGPLANLKALLITASGGLVAYAVNRFAIEKGAPLAAIGFMLAGILSVFAMLLVGAAMFMSTFSGLVLKDVAQRQLQDHGAALSDFVGERNRASLLAARVGPALRMVADDLTKNAHSEIAHSTLSGRGQGGRGPVAIALEVLAGKATAAAAQFEAGQSSATQTLTALNGLIAEYQNALSRNEHDVWQKQAELLKIHARIEQQASVLAETIPLSLFRSYADELVAGSVIAERPEATRRINAILSQHAETLAGVLPADNRSEDAPPAFPGRPGVADTLAYVADFSSIAAIVLVAELMLPVTLWTFTYLRLAWTIEKAEKGLRHPSQRRTPSGPFSLTTPPPPGKRDDFDGLIQLPPPRTENPRPRPRRRRRHGRRS